MPSDYIYSTAQDTIRIRIFRREAGWDFDVFKRGVGYVLTYTSEAADGPFSTKKQAKTTAENAYGRLRSIQPTTVTEGW